MKRFIVPFLLAAAVVLSFSTLSLTEETRPAEDAAVKAAKGETLYGNHWGIFTAWGDVFMVVDMRKVFETARRLWKKKFGSASPYRCSVVADPVESWFDYYAAVQFTLLAERGWTLVTSSGDKYVFRKKLAKEPEDPPPLLAAKLEDDDLPVEPKGQGYHPSMSTFPITRPLDLSLPTYCNLRYGSQFLLVPPYAAALRIYSNVPLDKDAVCFPLLPYLHIPRFSREFYEVSYDKEAANVIRIDLRSRLIPDFWKWRILFIKIYSLPYKEEGKNIFIEWFAWEFLDENGDPLPADSPLPVAFFPQNFKEYFHPIPLEAIGEQP